MTQLRTTAAQVIEAEGSVPVKIWTEDIDVVMENQKSLVAVVHVLKQVMCCKGA